MASSANQRFVSLLLVLLSLALFFERLAGLLGGGLTGRLVGHVSPLSLLRPYSYSRLPTADEGGAEVVGDPERRVCVIPRQLCRTAPRPDQRMNPGGLTPAVGGLRPTAPSMALQVAEADSQVIPKREELEPARDRLKRIKSDAEGFCLHHEWRFRAKTGKQSLLVGEDPLPGRSSLIDRVVGVEASELRRGLGATLWWNLSNFAPGGMDGLLQAVERNRDPDPSTPSGNIMVRYDPFVWLLDACGRATLNVT